MREKYAGLFEPGTRERADADLLAALANKNRLMILCNLLNQEMAVQPLAARRSPSRVLVRVPGLPPGDSGRR
mgnify:CR=1 FL=1